MPTQLALRPTVIIGLGGTGRSTLLQLKKRFIEEHKGSVPPIVRFICFDTEDRAGVEDNSQVDLPTLDDREFFSLFVPEDEPLIRQPHIARWWPPSIPLKGSKRETSHIRARGLLALVCQSRAIRAFLLSAINDAKTLHNQKEARAVNIEDLPGIDVFIISSLGGGLGSGMLLDLAFMVRDLTEAEGEDQHNIHAVLVLPRALRALSDRDEGKAMMNGNAYAALKEIEHFSKAASLNFKIDYGNTVMFKVRRQPFDLVTLIDQVNEDGRVIGDFNTLCRLIANGIYLQIVARMGAGASETRAQLKIAGNYSSFGVASLNSPKLAWKQAKLDAAVNLIGNELLGDPGPEPAQKKANTLIGVDWGLSYENVIAMLIEHCEAETLFSLGQLGFDGRVGGLIEDLYRRHQQKLNNELPNRVQTNFDDLLQRSLRALDNWYKREIDLRNGLARIESVAERLMAEFNACSISSDGDKDKRHVRGDLAERLAQVKASSAGFFPNKSHIKAACGALKRLVDKQSQVRLRQIADTKAVELFQRLEQRCKEIIAEVGEVKHNLEDVLQSIAELRSSDSLVADPYVPFEPELGLDPNTQRLFMSTPTDFLRSYRESDRSIYSWKQLTVAQVRDDILDYLDKHYWNLGELTMEQVLGRTSRSFIAQDLEKLQDLATPLWKYRDEIARSASHEAYCYGVQAADTTIFHSYTEDGDVPHGASLPLFVSTLDPTRIWLLRIRYGVPLKAIDGISELEKTYNDPYRPVSHHVRADWESFADPVTPIPSGALRAFAVALVPKPFEIITEQNGSFYLSSQNRHSLGGQLLGSNRREAFDAFAKNWELVEDVERRIRDVIRSKGHDEVIKTWYDYLEDNTGRIEATNDQRVKEQLQNEVKAIDEYRRELANRS